jgi:hypothetical protein
LSKGANAPMALRNAPIVALLHCYPSRGCLHPLKLPQLFVWNYKIPHKHNTQNLNIYQLFEFSVSFLYILLGNF